MVACWQGNDGRADLVGKGNQALQVGVQDLARASGRNALPLASLFRLASGVVGSALFGHGGVSVSAAQQTRSTTLPNRRNTAQNLRLAGPR